MAGRTLLRLRFGRFLWIASIAGAAALIVSLAMGARRPPVIHAQAGERAKQLAAGKILVARRSLLDPNFSKTVILLVQHDDEGTLGLVINRQTKVPLSRLSEELAGAKDRTDLLYLGGPVETTGIMALVRTKTKPDDAKRVLTDVFVISTKSTLEKTIAAATAPNTFRLYLGYAGWDAEQLEWELGLDAWDVLPADAGIAFDPHPETLWLRLAEQEGLQIAKVGLGVPGLSN